jgi:hypothetical protein
VAQVAVGDARESPFQAEIVQGFAIGMSEASGLGRHDIHDLSTLETDNRQQPSFI